jgi:gamma-glutamyltranspeptidase
VHTTAPPQTGGARFLLMLNIAEALDLQHHPPANGVGAHPV